MGAKPAKTFTNWSENLSNSTKIQYPRSDKDLIKIVREANKKHANISVVGAGHSISPTVCDSDERHLKLISLSKYSLLPEDLHINHDAMTVTVNAGWSLSKLYHELNKYRYFLDTQPASAAFNIAGLIQTPVHGARLGASHLADSLLQLRLIDDKGEIVYKRMTDPDFWYYPLSCGIFGIITSLTFKIYKHENFTLQTSTHSFPTDTSSLDLKDPLNQFFLSCIRKCIDGLKGDCAKVDDVKQVEHAQCFFDLHASKILCLKWVESSHINEAKEWTEPTSVWKNSLLESFLKTIDSDYRQSPLTLSLISKFARHTIGQNVEKDFSTNRDLFWLSSAVRAFFMEYYIPIWTEPIEKDTPKNTVSLVDYEDHSSDEDACDGLDIRLEPLYKAINVVIKATKRAKKAGKLFIPDLPCEFRFVVSSSCKLSPIYSEKKIVYLGIEIPCLAAGLSLNPGGSTETSSTSQTDSDTEIGSDLNSDFFEFYSQVEKGWQNLGGQPHWGKLFGFNCDHVRTDSIFNCSHLLDHQVQILLQSLAPKMFINDFAKKILGIP